ncbi:unnamed protein product [Rodentolepis nana]|uniref:Ovule protein n=1 Tax=Rodentolepis nana TaxID=102285 RepID=A0A0R3TTH1_RODNA|nr:unnamed protein product [Rodentolepis nana]
MLVGNQFPLLCEDLMEGPASSLPDDYRAIDTSALTCTPISLSSIFSSYQSNADSNELFVGVENFKSAGYLAKWLLWT